MPDEILIALTTFMGFFAIMNPIANTPVFVGLTADFTNSERKKTAFKAVLTAFVIIALFSFLGNIIFKLFGITLFAFKLAGGILLFFVGFDLLQGKQSSVHHPTGDNHEDNHSEPNDIAISPLALPILAGPGTISTAMNFVGSSNDPLHISIVVACFALLCVITYLMFVSGNWLVKKLGTGIIKVITRIMGMILTVIAAQMLIEGVKGAFNIA
ncbi:MAG: NAAT family transporter [Bacteroidetes bacterium]|jgi:multiple antibiotic resistance protein|nr:NAAT family transporter [Bacteroidota bacterium]